MGTQQSKTAGAPVRGLEELLKSAMRIAHVAVSDLYSYREGIKPIIEKITENKEKYVEIEVDRNKIYEHAMSRYTAKIRSLRTGMKPTHELPVIHFTGGEDDDLDYDGNGFRRQYYAVFFQECLKRLFEGSGRNKLPKHDLSKKEEFTALGIAIVEAILNGDCGFPYLNKSVFATIMDKTPDEIETALDIDDIPEGDVLYTVKQIKAAKTEKEMTNAVTGDESNFINFIGWPQGQAITLKQRELLLQYITKWVVLDQRLSEIEQLRKGLNYMGFLDTIKSNSWFEPLFVHAEQYSITAEYMKQKLEPLIDKMKVKDESQSRAQKQAGICIASINDAQARLLFAFITGLYDPPIVEESFSVEFNSDKKSRYPTSYTCLNKLILPVANKDLNQFEEAFWGALHDMNR